MERILYSMTRLMPSDVLNVNCLGWIVFSTILMLNCRWSYPRCLKVKQQLFISLWRVTWGKKCDRAKLSHNLNDLSVATTLTCYLVITSCLWIIKDAKRDLSKGKNKEIYVFFQWQTCGKQTDRKNKAKNHKFHLLVHTLGLYSTL